MEQPKTYIAIDSIFRKSYGKILSVLSSKYANVPLEDVENAIMESYYKALKTWPFNGTPENAQGWLYNTSKRYIIDGLRRKNVHHKATVVLRSAEDIFPAKELEAIKDPELQLLFNICHPALKEKDQLVFMLKTLSGFGLREIASALLTTEEAVKKRLSRARKKLDRHHLRLSLENDAIELEQRLPKVHKVLYLLFNEGFYSSHPKKKIRKELCLEAIRFCKFLSEHELANTNTFALLSLMCYHVARIESRLDPSERLIPLRDQDRSKWNQKFIDLGHHYLAKSAQLSSKKSDYQLEALIACQHCIAKTYDNTNWALLKDLYSALYNKRHNQIILLNLTLVNIQLKDLDEARRIFEMLDEKEFRKYRSAYYLIGFELYEHLSDHFQTKHLVEKALACSTSEQNADWIRKRFAHLINEN